MRWIWHSVGFSQILNVKGISFDICDILSFQLSDVSKFFWEASKWKSAARPPVQYPLSICTHLCKSKNHPMLLLSNWPQLTPRQGGQCQLAANSRFSPTINPAPAHFNNINRRR